MPVQASWPESWDGPIGYTHWCVRLAGVIVKLNRIGMQRSHMTTTKLLSVPLAQGDDIESNLIQREKSDSVRKAQIEVCDIVSR